MDGKNTMVTQIRSDPESTPIFSDEKGPSWNGKNVKEETCCESCCICACKCFYNPVTCCGVCSITCIVAAVVFGSLMIWSNEQDFDNNSSLVFGILAGIFIFAGAIGGVKAMCSATTTVVRSVYTNEILRVGIDKDNARLSSEADEQGREVGLDCAHSCCG